MEKKSFNARSLGSSLIIYSIHFCSAQKKHDINARFPHVWRSIVYFFLHRASTCICALIHKTLYLLWCGCVHTRINIILALHCVVFFLVGFWKNNSLSDCEVSIIFLFVFNVEEPYLYLSSQSNIFTAKNAQKNNFTASHAR